MRNLCVRSLSKGGLNAAPWFDKLTMELEMPDAHATVLSPSKSGPPAAPWFDKLTRGWRYPDVRATSS
jgi:hypothetical protein